MRPGGSTNPRAMIAHSDREATRDVARDRKGDPGHPGSSTRMRIRSSSQISGRTNEFGGISACGRTVRILGTHGVPGHYGGFETAAENVALFLRDQGWRVIVYCQIRRGRRHTAGRVAGPRRGSTSRCRDGLAGHVDASTCSRSGTPASTATCASRSATTPPSSTRSSGSRRHPQRHQHGRHRVVPGAAGAYAAGDPATPTSASACWVGDHLIADHPEISAYLRSEAKASKITTITYGAHPSTRRPDGPRRRLRPRRRALFHPDLPADPRELDPRARPGLLGPKPAASSSPSSATNPPETPYHRAGAGGSQRRGASSSARSTTPRPSPRCASTRLGYLHGHTVGGTNPSLVEAMAAGNAVIAHDNVYNRWVAGDAALYFTSPAGRRCTASTGARPGPGRRMRRGSSAQRAARRRVHLGARRRPVRGAPRCQRLPATRHRQRQRKEATMIKVGVVGLGKMGLSHLVDPGCPSRGRGGRRCATRPATSSTCSASTPAFPTFTDYAKMLRDGDLDAVHPRDPDPPARPHGASGRSTAVSTCSARSRCAWTRPSPRRSPRWPPRRASSPRSATTTASSAPSGRSSACSTPAPSVGSRTCSRRPTVRSCSSRGLDLAQPDGGGRRLPLRLRRPPDRPAHLVLRRRRWPIGGTLLGSIFSTETDDEVFTTLYFADGVTGQLLVNWSDESQRKMSTKITSGAPRAASTPTARRCRSTFAGAPR